MSITTEIQIEQVTEKPTWRNHAYYSLRYIYMYMTLCDRGPELQCLLKVKEDLS